MRIQLLFPFFFFLTFTAIAQQPANDECAGAISLGLLPACSDEVYTNVGATATNIGAGNIPGCFNGGSVNRDVWFTFTTNDTLIDISIIVQGSEAGNNNPVSNPQAALYRGNCGGLADLGFCASASDGDSQLKLDILGLTPNTTYYLRINDYSPTASPNSGDFTICIEEYVPAINMGEETNSAACFGTLYDSGGPDGDYGNQETHLFVIQPEEFTRCIELRLLDFQLENEFDFLNIYEGTGTSGNLLSSITGFSNGEPFVIQASSSAVTVEFLSDLSLQEAGFELEWSCSPIACNGSSFDNPLAINGLPFNQSGFSTCDDASNFAETPCSNVPFINGPDYVFAYTSAGGFCADVRVNEASPGTGVLVLNGLPDDPETLCLAQSPAGNLASVNFQEAGTYYIVVANAAGCTDFGLSIIEAECRLDPSLAGSLCNPLNGCVSPDGVPSVFNFNRGFEDIAFTPGVNDGCWVTTGSDQPNYYWFTIEAQAEGPFGFIVQADNPAEASDIDFNVWGPFSREEVCETPQSIVDFIENNQPIRSSYAGGEQPTGLAQFNADGDPVNDAYDCETVPGANGDDFASVIQVQPGEIYAVLINDWGNDILSGAISVDWSPTDPAVLAPPDNSLITMDTAICQGESVQLMIDAATDNIRWEGDTVSLSCTDCPDPVATPEETSFYRAIIEGVCTIDTFEITVQVFSVDAGPDIEVCRGEEIQVVAGSEFFGGTYEWSAPAGISLSCTDCPDPFLVAENAGTYTVSVTLDGLGCTLQDEKVINVLPQEAPPVNISEGEQICVGDAVNIGGAPVAGLTYSWSSEPAGFTSTAANPQVSPNTTTTYFLSVRNNSCPLPSVDSLQLVVDTPPLISLGGDTTVCQEEPIELGSTEREAGVTYTWTGPDTILDTLANDPSPIALPQNSGTYTLTATRGACTVEGSFEVEIVPIAASIIDEDMLEVGDTLRLCRGDELSLNSMIIPQDSTGLWTSTQPGFDSLVAPGIVVAPEETATYYLQLSVEPGCFKIDSVVVAVDSLPSGLAIMPADTTVCEGSLVTLKSTIYEPADFPEIEFLWTPATGQETPDTLYNMVITALDSIVYMRTNTSGACVDTSFATVNVTPTPIVNVSVTPNPICAGDEVQLTGEVSENVDEFEWIMGGEILSDPMSLTPTANPQGTTTFTLEAKTDDCPAQASVTVQALQPPNPILTTRTTICLGETLPLLEGGIDDNTSYEWTSSDPDFGVVTDPNVVVQPTEPTTYFLTADNGLCEPAMLTISIDVLPPPILSVSASAPTICEGESVTLSAQVENGADGDAFLWRNSNNALVGEGPSIQLSPSATDTYTLTYVSGAGCGTLQESLTIEVLPAPVAAPISDTVICLGDSIELNLASDENTVYTWTSTDPNFTDFNTPQPVVSPSETTTYTLAAENGACPPAEAEITVEVIGPVNLSVSASADLICPGEEVTLTAIAEGGTAGDSFSWEGSDGTTFTGDMVTVMPEAATVYTLTYESAGGCETLTASLTVEVEPPVFLGGIEVEPDSIITFFIGDQALFTAIYDTEIEDPLDFEWTRNDSLFDSGLGLASVQDDLLVGGDITYGVRITTPNGCEYEDEVVITVEIPRIAVPNVFTPNGDSQNDFFTLLSQGDPNGLSITEFQVFNRWGQMVYDNDTPETGWDGTFNGKPQPSEVYFYMIRVQLPNGTELDPLRGDVTLLR